MAHHIQCVKINVYFNTMCIIAIYFNTSHFSRLTQPRVGELIAIPKVAEAHSPTLLAIGWVGSYLTRFFPPSNKWKLPTLTVRGDLHVSVSWWAVSSFGKKGHTRVFWDIWEAGCCYQGMVGKRSKAWGLWRISFCCFWLWHKSIWAEKKLCDQE